MLLYADYVESKEADERFLFAGSGQGAMWRLAHSNMGYPALVAVVAESVTHKGVDQFTMLNFESDNAKY